MFSAERRLRKLLQLKDSCVSIAAIQKLTQQINKKKTPPLNIVPHLGLIIDRFVLQVATAKLSSDHAKPSHFMYVFERKWQTCRTI